MTPRQLIALRRAAKRDAIHPGTALMYEQQAGFIRQIRWLLGRGLIRQRHGRLIATKFGRDILDYNGISE